MGEIIRSIQKPISTYVDEIVRAFHEKLCKDLLPVGKCRSPDDCNKKTKPSDLCKSCKCWFKELKDSHEKGNSPSWHKNCKSAEWSEDHWAVAKFFMPALGSNLSTVKDAQSTDLSSLLNVLEWMKDRAFLGKTRVNVDLVRKLRSQVRNTWAHAPQQEFTNDETAEGFSIATDFLDGLEKVWSHAESGKCLEHLKRLKTNGVTNVAESELQILVLQRHLLIQARKPLEKSLELRKTLTGSSVGIADKVFSLLQLGRICKLISTSEHYLDKEDESKKSREKAEKYYREAIQLSKNDLGDHELTSSCYKSLVDLFLNIKKPNLAEKEYTTAKEMRENLGLDASEKYVYLLNNLGKCLTECKRPDEAIELLESARDMAEKLAENDKPNVYKAKVYTSLAFAYNSLQDSENAVKYAKKALEFDGLCNVIRKHDYKNLNSKNFIKMCWKQLTYT